MSSVGEGRIYFDSGSNVFKVSENGGAYVNLVGGGGGTTYPVAPSGGSYTTSAGGTNATALGDAASASGNTTLAAGYGAQATDTNCVVVGPNASAGDPNCVAVGQGSVAGGNDATALGDTANAGNSQTVAIGSTSQATFGASIAVGYGANAGGVQAVVVGSGSSATNSFGTVVGSSSTAAFNAVTVGTSSAVGDNGVSVGSNIVNSGANSIVVGQGAQSLGDGCTVIGPGAQGGTAGQTNVVVVGGSQAVGTDIVVMGSAAVVGTFLMSVGVPIDPIATYAPSTEVTAIGPSNFGGVAGRQFVMVGNRGNEGLIGDNIYAVGHRVGVEDTNFMSQILLGAGARPTDAPYAFVAGSNRQATTDVYFGTGAYANGPADYTIHGTRANSVTALTAPSTPTNTLDPTAGGWTPGTYSYFATKFDGVGESIGSALGSFTITGSEAPILDGFDLGTGTNAVCGMYVYIEAVAGSGVYYRAKPQEGTSTRYLVSGLGPELYNTQPTGTEPSRAPTDPSYTRTGVGGAVNLAGGYGVDAANTGGNVGFYTARTGSADTLTLAGYFNGGDGSLSVPGTGGSTSERFGLSTTATGASSLAVGNQAHAEADFATVVGAEADADQQFAVAVGYQSYAGTLAARSTSVGAFTGSVSYGTVMIGYNTKNTGGGADYAIGIGYDVTVDNSNAIAIGRSVSLTGGATDMIAIGTSASCTNQSGIAFGRLTSVTADRGIAIGLSSAVTGQGGIAIGVNGTTAKERSVSIGEGNPDGTSYGFSVSIGGFNTMTGSGDAICIGDANQAGDADSSVGMIAIGLACYVTGTGDCIALGDGAECDGGPTGHDMIAIGDGASCSGTAGLRDAIAIGDGPVVQSSNCVAIGRAPRIGIGHDGSVALGWGSTTSAAQQFVAGSLVNVVTNVYFGAGPTRSGQTGVTGHYTINGSGGQQFGNADGGDLSLAGGTGFSAGNLGGKVRLKVAFSGAATTLTDAVIVDNVAGWVSVGSATPASHLDIQGTSGFKGQTLTADTTLDNTSATDSSVIVVDATSNPVTVTLPTAASATFRRYVFVRSDAVVANAVTVAGNGGETINGAATYPLPTQWASVEVWNDGVQWFATAVAGNVFTGSKSNVYADGLGPIDHLVGPTDQFLRLVSPDSAAPTGVIVYGGDATTGNANGGAVGLQGGDGDGTGFGGVVTVSGGAATSATGFGGNVSILGGPASLGNQAGQVNITGGTVGGSGQSGSVVISTPNGSGAAGRSGAIQLTCGNNSTTNNQSGLGIAIASGKGGGVGGMGGSVNITGGQGGDTTTAGAGGAISITAGNAGTVALSSADGGSVLISAGGGTGTTGNGGDVTLTPGPAAGGGTNGAIKFNGRAQGQLGSAVASANDIALTFGNLFSITGNTTINTISATGWRAGSVVTLLFASTPTVADNTAGTGASILLNGSTNFAVTAGSTLTLVYDGSTWTEIARMTR